MLRMPNHLRRAHGPGWALVGDAGYHRDAVTGHGLSDAYRDAELLAVALAPGAVRRGRRGHRAGRLPAPARPRAARGLRADRRAGRRTRRVPEFVELQKQLARALDAEAAELAARSPMVPASEHQLA